mmetsp:Transcript_65232/g.147145  ORF Transcript_65232/g.147145 Transcript_65232/m.147145 type:complete len:204 (+) Transcript_65232:942-1553(+)
MTLAKGFSAARWTKEVKTSECSSLARRCRYRMASPRRAERSAAACIWRKETDRLAVCSVGSCTRDFTCVEYASTTLDIDMTSMALESASSSWPLTIWLDSKVAFLALKVAPTSARNFSASSRLFFELARSLEASAPAFACLAFDSVRSSSSDFRLERVLLTCTSSMLAACAMFISSFWRTPSSSLNFLRSCSNVATMPLDWNS